MVKFVLHKLYAYGLLSLILISGCAVLTHRWLSTQTKTYTVKKSLSDTLLEVQNNFLKLDLTVQKFVSDVHLIQKSCQEDASITLRYFAQAGVFSDLLNALEQAVKNLLKKTVDRNQKNLLLATLGGFYAFFTTVFESTKQMTDHKSLLFLWHEHISSLFIQPIISQPKNQNIVPAETNYIAAHRAVGFPTQVQTIARHSFPSQEIDAEIINTENMNQNISNFDQSTYANSSLQELPSHQDIELLGALIDAASNNNESIVPQKLSNQKNNTTDKKTDHAHEALDILPYGSPIALTNKTNSDLPFVMPSTATPRQKEQVKQSVARLEQHVQELATDVGATITSVKESFEREMVAELDDFFSPVAGP